MNSLGLTEKQPENNVIRILLETLAVTLSRNARARAVQLPAWNEALGLPRPWDQQWSLRMQQILAFETDLLEHADLFDGNPVVTQRVEALKADARAELTRIEAMGGAVAAIEHMKSRLVESNAARVRKIETGETMVVGVNCYTDTAESPLSACEETVLQVDAKAEERQIEDLVDWRRSRDTNAVSLALEGLRRAAAGGENVLPPSIAAARAGATTGEWGDVMRSVFGEYRAPTGVSASPSNMTENLDAVREAVDQVYDRLRRRLKLLIGKPGLDGHSNGAEQLAFRARDCGIDVIYAGIRFTAEEIVNAALEEKVHVVGLSILSGSHLSLVGDTVDLMRRNGIAHIPLVVGGIIPDDDARRLEALGVAAIYTPKDYDLNRIILDIVELAAPAQRAA